MEDREELEYILDRVTRSEDARDSYRKRASNWEEMYKLNAGFGRTLLEAVADGQEQIVNPAPFNVVNLSQRLLSTTPKIDVIPLDPAELKSVGYAEQCERFLSAMWRQINRDQRRNILGDAIWHMLVRGRVAIEVKWIRDKLPRLRKKTTFPILIRALEPLHVGGHMGPYGTEFAYHKYEESILDVLRRYPDLKDAAQDTKMRAKLDELDNNKHSTEDQTVSVIDYWAMDPEDGWIGNAILVEDEFVKPYEMTSYPDVPIIMGRGDYAPGLGEEYDGMSILHAMDGLWQYECRLDSQMATGVAWDYWPAVTVTNENGNPIDDIVIGPGITTPLPAGTKVELVRLQPNHQLAQAMHDQIDGYIQQSTYSSVVYGEIPDSQLSGWGVSMLTENTKGRIKNFQEGLEMVFSHVHSQVLALVEKKGGKQGVSVYGVNERDKDKYRLTLDKEMIGGNYENLVRITPAVPADSLQRAVMGKQFGDGGYLSKQTVRDEFLDVQVPSDETRRIAFEQFMESDEMRSYVMRRAAEEGFKEDSLEVLFETPWMPVAPGGFVWVKNDNGKVILQPAPPQQAAPMTTPSTEALGIPPGGGISNDGSLMPGGSGALPVQPPATFVPPMGGGMPPVMQGQLEGESLGLNPQLDPLAFAMATGQQLPPGEELNLAAGLPRDGVPYGY